MIYDFPVSDLVTSLVTALLGYGFSAVRAWWSRRRATALATDRLAPEVDR